MSSGSLIPLNQIYLARVGLGDLSSEQAQAALKWIYETLEQRVGTELANRMTEEQLNEFEVFFNGQDDVGALRWLKQNRPDYERIVREAHSRLIRDVFCLRAAIRRAVGAVPPPATESSAA